MCNRALDRLDERLRRALLGRAGAPALAAVAALALLAFAALLVTRTLRLLSGAELPARAVTLALLCVPLALALCFAVNAARENGRGLLAAAALCAACALAMLMRLSFIDHVSADYELYFSGWIDQLGARSFSEGMRAQIGEYNVLYQYLLFFVSRLPAPPLYALKAVSLAGDALLAGAVSRLAAREGKASEAGLVLTLLLPSIALNGAMFAQCDSLYAACALWGLALSFGGNGKAARPAAAAACFALSLALKLQAVFLLPIVAVLWAGRRLRLKDALAFLATLLLVALPAALGGKPLSEIAGIYAAQTGLYTGLTYNAPTLFGLLNTAGLDVYAYGNFGIALALGACALLVSWGVSHAGELDKEDLVLLALRMTLAVVFLLPRMHERYFYLAGALSVAAAARDRRLIPCAALLECASLGTLWDLGLPLSACSAMALAALCWAFAAGARARNF